MVEMMVDEPYLPTRPDPDTGALRGFLEAPAEPQARRRRWRAGAQAGSRGIDAAVQTEMQRLRQKVAQLKAQLQQAQAH